MIRLDMGEPPEPGVFSKLDWARDCIRLVRSVDTALDERHYVQEIQATLTFHGVTVPVYPDDDTSRVSIRLSAAKPKSPETHPATMIGRSGRG